MNLMKSSSEIVTEAIAQYKPYAKVLMFSGGGDSMTALHVCLKLGVKPDYVLHINTRTGIPETTAFVRQYVEQLGIPYIEGDAGSRYENYVRRKGVFGVGTGKQSAHTFAYHLLKREVLTSAISANIRQRKRDRSVLLLNGARITESQNRADNFADKPIRKDGANIWVNVIHEWDKPSCKAFCAEQKCPKNPVNELLCRSGECMCGTTQGQQARAEVAYWFPHWGRWIDGLEAEVKQKFPWGWGESVPQGWRLEKEGQLRLFDNDFMPMCSTCIENAAIERRGNEQ